MESHIKTAARREHSHADRTVRQASFSLRSGLALLACLVLLLAALWLVRTPKVAADGGVISNSRPVQGDALANPESVPKIQTAGAQEGAAAGSPAAQPVQPSESVSATVATPEARRLVERLIHPESAGGILTQERTDAWK